MKKNIMASNEHKHLANFLKDVHLSLRKQSSVKGVEAAWKDHCKDEDVLSKYAKYMEKLATTYWNTNNSNERGTISRIKWAADIINAYFFNNLYIEYRKKDINIGEKINLTLNTDHIFTQPFKLLDVGSCYNPFRIFDFLDVLAIDLYPANEMVFQCDFIHVLLGPHTIVNNNKVEQLQENTFDVITFCFLLEYLPNSELRIQVCQNAYKLLKSEGLLIIATPDSKHVGANSKFMKCWRYTLAFLGFSRIKYEKFQHMHCMAFRKSLHLNVAARWAELHKEPYMSFDINIPQDFTVPKDSSTSTNVAANSSIEELMELPFYESSLQLSDIL